MKLFTFLLVFCLLFSALPASAQTELPNNFTGAGLGFQNDATPKTSGWFEACTKITGKTFGCIANDVSGGVTSERAELEQQFYGYKACNLFGKSSSGVATGANGGLGGSFDLGGTVVCSMPKKLAVFNGIVAVFSGSWQKNNVLQPGEITNTLKQFGNQTVWRFGFGRAW